MRGTVRTDRFEEKVDLTDFNADFNRLVSPFGKKKMPAESPHVRITGDEIIFSGPGRLRLLAYGHERHFNSYADECAIDLSLYIAGVSHAVNLKLHFITTSGEDDEDYAWTYVPDAVRHRAEISSA
jgi:hypothetical protein